MTNKPLAAIPPALLREGLVARLRKRMFEPLGGRSARPAAPPKPARRDVGFQASLAEFLLINRLRARRKAEPSADVLERGARILQVTCKHWFAPERPPRSGTPQTRL
jgi:hypothetical protein